MIWIAATGLVFAVALYLTVPFFSQSAAPASDNEILAYRAELKALNASEDITLGARKAELETKLLHAAKADAPHASKASWTWPAAISALLLLGTFGIYSQIGSPNFTPQQPQIQTAQPNPDFAALLPQLEARLAETPDDPTGWYLYGRTLMLVDRYEDGFAAYERALELSDNNAEIAKELASAREFAAAKSAGPNADDIAAAQNMTADERIMMIRGMVEGLREKLTDNPKDAAGWTRLLRARKVLGQTNEAKADIAVLRDALPDQAEAIIRETGWAK